jgi:hypothetical protein
VGVQQQAQGLSGVLGELVGAISATVSAIRDAAKAPSGGSPAEGYQHGGLVGGPTGMVHEGEFVVTKSGSNLMDAISHFVPSYQQGGLVTSTFGGEGFSGGRIQAMSPGNPNTGGRPLELHFNNEPIGGGVLHENTAKNLSKLATEQLINRGGSISWYVGR